ncbi:tetratricopeptide repeat protein [Paracoccus caeni]|uniref:Tetratricopeptide repeat protein n=1 Tax=Paracoccus caeni TaxID=657651 RepID=A0A934SGZ4_9RHOB|nr:tetratricopeptide repeat protein [Paracoccus caeni]MBK4214333.1 tetratricopeptide repeat protein [Paracoccus caeni]
MNAPLSLIPNSIKLPGSPAGDDPTDERLEDLYGELGNWDEAEALPDDLNTADARKHGRILSSLALLYLRHGDPSRAMVLSLAALSMGDARPSALLTLAESLLRAGDPEQAMSVLTRFDETDPALIETPATDIQHAARHYIRAKALHRQGDNIGARDALALARDLRVAADARKDDG